MSKNIGEQPREDEEIIIDPEQNRAWAKQRLEGEAAKATEVQKELASDQATNFETSVVTLLRRSESEGKINVDVVNGLQSLLRGLEFYATFEGQGIMGAEKQQELAAFLAEVGNALKNTVATKGRSKAVDVKVDFSRWETKKK
ncbi:MAG: hypothetical protein A2599_02420 [Candidatus Staskawiczbacteria bacterium RIFOXYD1_FULL_39_28]|uniref:Uncharacterized protein n=1 Tax=Candidatus Staskawiczbacteria bacterium RIFOXYC1_FULL_38_18 TaxID=1802229 RepID=A0A1G2JE25_9BACT|nr:MAG: hypothetical protein A2401_01850 [Candidatus Staskawiczbacteria bacterium RIFOXYC1_FULL_38_18]OGZ90513.1 MAG: hypothetical protein A2599_02420 [Candidatus Staskawiczbacteria bacterium RIFOXYD1_FULL_39_28]